MSSSFKYASLQLSNKNKIVFTSYSKRNFYLRLQISAFALLKNCTPINPFMNLDYNLAGLVDKKLIRIANNTMLKKSDELWVFGNVSDGVLIEIFLAKKANKPIRFFELSEGANDFKEIDISDVKLEDVSPWMWEWVVTGKNLQRWHPRLRSNKTYPLVYPAYSKRNFFWYMHVSKFCIEKKVIPLNPFMLFKYFLGDMVPRKAVYSANNSIIRIVDSLWTFGQISDGVLAEAKMIKDRGGEVKLFKIIKGDPVKFRQTTAKGITYETEDGNLKQYKKILE